MIPNSYFYWAYPKTLTSTLKKLCFSAFRLYNHVLAYPFIRASVYGFIAPMELPQWNCPNGIAPMELPQWNCPNGIAPMELPQWNCPNG
ncbi:MAG: hypothetical protein ACI9K1_000150, partial [Arcticibacterium sp.]